MKISLVSLNGQFGCLTLTLGKLCVCIGLRPSLAGIDIVYDGRFIVGPAI